MTKKILKMLIRIAVISVLLYCSYYIYTHYTGFAIRMIEFEKIVISSIFHCFLFFIMGIALRFKLGLISAIKNKSVNVNFVKLGAAIAFLVAILFLTLKVYMYISCFLALLTGFFFIDSFEFNNK